MTHPTFENCPDLRTACAERCAVVGDPACWQMAGEGSRQGKHIPMGPCGECLRDIGVEPGDEFDEDAAIGRLL